MAFGHYEEMSVDCGFEDDAGRRMGRIPVVGTGMHHLPSINGGGSSLQPSSSVLWWSASAERGEVSIESGRSGPGEDETLLLST